MTSRNFAFQQRKLLKCSLKPVYPVVLPSTVQQVLLQFMVELLAGFHLLDTRSQILFTLAR